MPAAVAVVAVAEEAAGALAAVTSVVLAGVAAVALAAATSEVSAPAAVVAVISAVLAGASAVVSVALVAHIGGSSGRIGGVGISSRGAGPGLGARSLGGPRIGSVGNGARSLAGSRTGISAARLNGPGNHLVGVSGRNFGVAGSVRGAGLGRGVFGNRAIGNVALRSQFASARFHGRFFGSRWPWWRGGLVVGWIGPVFWPYAYYDFFDYVYWPYAYDDFWPYAYDDVYYGIYGDYAYVRRRRGRFRPQWRVRPLAVPPRRAAGRSGVRPKFAATTPRN